MTPSKTLIWLQLCFASFSIAIKATSFPLVPRSGLQNNPSAAAPPRHILKTHCGTTKSLPSPGIDSKSPSFLETPSNETCSEAAGSSCSCDIQLRSKRKSSPHPNLTQPFILVAESTFSPSGQTSCCWPAGGWDAR